MIKADYLDQRDHDCWANSNGARVRWEIPYLDTIGQHYYFRAIILNPADVVRDASPVLHYRGPEITERLKREES